MSSITPADTTPGDEAARRAIAGIVIAIIVIILFLFALIWWTIFGCFGTGRLIEKARIRRAEKARREQEAALAAGAEMGQMNAGQGNAANGPTPIYSNIYANTMDRDGTTAKDEDADTKDTSDKKSSKKDQRVPPPYSMPTYNF